MARIPFIARENLGMAEKKHDTAAADDAGQAEVQETFDAIEEKGYIGTVPDETPNENYTVQGVVSGAPTPETTKERPA